MQSACPNMLGSILCHRVQLFSTVAVKLDLVHQRLYPQPMATVSREDTGTKALSAAADKWVLSWLYIGRHEKEGDCGTWQDWVWLRISFLTARQRKQCSLETLGCSLEAILLCSYFANAEKWGMFLFQGSWRLPGLLTRLHLLRKND